MKKIVLVGLLAGLVMLVVGIGLSQLLNLIFPSLGAEYNNTNLFRPWSDPLMSIYFVEPFVVGIIWAWIWNRAKELIRDEKNWKRGACFGLVYWLTTIPGMVMSYSSFPLSLLMTLSWTMTIFIQSLAAGLIFAKLNK